jgi:hypothetical protein
MARLVILIALALLTSVLSNAPLANEDEESSVGLSLGDSVPLDESDLQNITLQVLKENPLLSSSPGIKYAEAIRSVRSTDIADVIFYPHAESAGIKQAFQVNCSRQEPNQSWICNPARIRRYLQLDSQDFEVRVKGEIGSFEALALIQATRDVLRASATDGSITPQTAIMIYPHADGYRVTWGSSEGFQEIIVRARLSDEGNPANPEDWQARIYEPENQ